MIKVSGSIIDDKLNVIGLTVSGKASELGVMQAPNKTVTRSYHLMDLAKLGFKTATVSVELDDGKAKVVYPEGSTARLRDFPVQLYTNEGLVPIENSAEFVGIKYNGSIDPKNVLVYVLKYCGKRLDIKRDDIMKVSEVLNLDFKVVNGKDDVPYIVGKPGGKKKEDLKVEVVNLKNKDAVAKANPVNHGIDLVNLFDLANESKAYMLIDTGVTHMGSILINSTFIARPKLKFTAKNLNANITGELSGNCVAGGKALPVKAFKTVSLIKNGRVDDYTVKIVIPAENFTGFVSAISGAVSFSDVTDHLMRADIEAIKTKMSSAYYAIAIDLDGLNVLSDEHARSLICNNDKIDKLVTDIYTCKMCKTLINDKSGALQILAEVNGVENPAVKHETLGEARLAFENKMIDRSRVVEAYRNESDAILGELLEQGVNIFSGYYEQSARSTKEKDDSAIEIEYTNKYGKLTGFKKINDALIAGDWTYIPQGVRDLLAYLAVVKDTEVIYKSLEKYDDISEKAIRELALHKFAMCELSGYSAIHTMNSSDWEINTKYRGQGNKYTLRNSASGLAVVCKNIVIK